MPEYIITLYIMSTENVNDIFSQILISTRNAYILIRILELLKRPEKQEKNFSEVTPTNKSIPPRGCAPLHIYALFMYICTFYAYFMHFLVYSIVIIQPPKWHFLALFACQIVTLCALGGLKCFTTKERETIAHYKTPYIKCIYTPYVPRIYADI